MLNRVSYLILVFSMPTSGSRYQVHHAKTSSWNLKKALLKQWKKEKEHNHGTCLKASHTMNPYFLWDLVEGFCGENGAGPLEWPLAV